MRGSINLQPRVELACSTICSVCVCMLTPSFELCSEHTGSVELACSIICSVCMLTLCVCVCVRVCLCVCVYVYSVL